MSIRSRTAALALSSAALALPLFALAWLLGPGSYLQIIIVAVLQSAVLLYGIAGLERRLDAAPALPCAALAPVLYGRDRIRLD
jgi:hypothetical protein